MYEEWTVCINFASNSFSEWNALTSAVQSLTVPSDTFICMSEEHRAVPLLKKISGQHQDIYDLWAINSM